MLLLCLKTIFTISTAVDVLQVLLLHLEMKYFSHSEWFTGVTTTWEDKFFSCRLQLSVIYVLQLHLKVKYFVLFAAVNVCSSSQCYIGITTKP